MAGFRAWQRQRPEEATAELPYPILPSNTDAVMLFLTMQTQWRFAGDPPVETGLDYGPVSDLMELLDIVPDDERPDRRRVALSGLRIMESAALKARHGQHKAELQRQRNLAKAGAR